MNMENLKTFYICTNQKEKRQEKKRDRNEWANAKEERFHIRKEELMKL